MSDTLGDTGPDVAGATHPGRRPYNEDCYHIDSAHRLLLVADGVGGRRGGEIASRLACDVVSREVAAGKSLADALQVAHREILAAAARGKGKEGMATCLVAARSDGETFELAWVGDSRAYLWDGRLHLLTRDHSFVQSLVDAGEITADEAWSHPDRNIITQALGVDGSAPLQVGVNSGRLPAGSVLLLCTDGLSGELDRALLAAALATDEPAADLVSRLVDQADAAGGSDNITAVILRAGGHRAAAGPDTTAPAADEVVWSFDPATGKTFTPPPAAAGPRVTRVQPRVQQRVLEPVASDEPPREPGENSSLQAARRRARALVLLALVVLLLLFVWFGDYGVTP